MKRKIRTFIKNFVKFFCDYTIEDDYRILSLKHTPLRVRRSLTRKAWDAFGSLPIAANKVIFDNYMGRGYGCNCKYVTEALRKRRPDLDIVWTVRRASAHAGQFPEGVRLVEYGSTEALREYYTAALWVCNYHLSAYFNQGLVKREGQTYIQMWHGSLGIKKLERDCEGLTSMKHWNYLAQKNSNATDYWISNSAFETQVYRRGFWNVEHVLELGHPRNDIFFREDASACAAAVKNALDIKPERRIVLYVPTFRESGGFPVCRLDVDAVVSALARRFGGDWSFVVRLHPRMREGMDVLVIGGHVQPVDGSGYPDIQELLFASDVVLTDYSSCIFDFLLTGRPAFIYAPDIEIYNTERGFYYRLEETPFPIAESMEMLTENIARFDEDVYAERSAAFLKEKGCMENGRASEAVCDLIEEILDR